MKVKVKVKDCHDPSLWYSDKIGMSFDLVYCTEREVYVRTEDSYNTGNFICNENIEEIEHEYPTTR